MSEVNKVAEEVAAEAAEYQTPAIEQVVTREGFEREVAYAGVSIPSDLQGPN